MKNMFYFSRLVALIALLTRSCCTAQEEPSALPSASPSASPTVSQKASTEHQKRLRKTTVNFSDVDFSGDAATAASLAVDAIAAEMKKTGRFAELFEKAKTPECRELISKHYGYFLKAIATETPLPFASTQFDSSCEDERPWDFNNLPQGVHMGIVQNRTYQPPRNETNEDALYISAEEVVLCYGILAHDSAEATIRIIEAVDEPTTTFVVHIDGKYEENYEKLKEYANQRDRVVVLDHQHRVRVNWGGFSMVNATLQILNYIDRNDLQFTHFVHMASTSYPIVSNRRIRNTLAEYPIDANLMHIILRPARPTESIWNYFVECDDQLHRIHRLPIITKEQNNADFYTSSQWFIISKEFAHYLANPQEEEGIFLRQYLDYIEHAVVADENFFGTVLRNTRFCNKHHNWNFLHLMFDQWENEQDLSKRDQRKCMMPDPNHCGRSPTTLSLDYTDVLELSGDLYARKFVDSYDAGVKDAIDASRKIEEAKLTSLNTIGIENSAEDSDRETAGKNMQLEGHGTLIVATETINSTMPLCMGLGENFNLVRLVPCFHDEVVPTLANKWETGAVILDEVQNHTRWSIGPCSSNGNLERLDSGIVEVTPGSFMQTGPKCALTMMDGVRTGRCLDGESLDNQPGGPVHVYPCTKRWNQYLSFGNGKDAPSGTIHTVIPLYTQKRINATGREQEAYMCVGVARRGEKDEEDWFGEREEFFESYEELDEDLEALEQDGDANDDIGYHSLLYWLGQQLMTTRCSNEGAVLNWTLVPFVDEEEDSEGEEHIESSPQKDTDVESEDEEL
uniref:protein xylosyltransferase n=1 Tax=Pseudo-nitzschia australis TaxID=44445 RepID=A0A7S4EKK1_9STRA|mmetsp:Transcript_4922/g.10890  ORF Transcript_4922/g.10890 Transcript_4922/m.10890 type:complete len:795 (-) Transcript_4922:2388-4772(-)|eukprot:CAMPEP_0168166918 /NCGR_PEP_ID=MMETSP0139_2-20121125/2281_1 /TAXON_ID=44445 /ORGANISM="Pseudo-nitzschia australis, Strain 10249 10 AB" /LENGTH=794 /DNA_ID=CAMNT_0008084143 /DNA_START=179 /DNA_END=2563 /DNA_ORIENTATION=-